MIKPRKRISATQSGYGDIGRRPPPPTDAIWIGGYSRNDRSKGRIWIKSHLRRQKRQLPRDPVARILDLLVLDDLYERGKFAITAEFLAIVAGQPTSSRKSDAGSSARVDDRRATTEELRHQDALLLVTLLGVIFEALDDDMLAAFGLRRLTKTSPAAMPSGAQRDS